ncbi:MAG TPA: methyltransferase domain-containing protein [Kiloniellales bacterium]|nr:methyltransferase domain-containing protein [Kiloniellales bacterium]
MVAAAKKAPGATSAKAKPSFRSRFKAWWEGYELAATAQGPPKPLADKTHEVRYTRVQQRWETERILLAQEVWGEGYTKPGGDELTLTMVKVFGLNPAMSVLDLGAGLGGATRAMAEHFGVWVTGLESDPQLAEAGMALSVKHGLAKKAPIETFDPAAIDLEGKTFDCVFSKEYFYAVADKEALLRSLAGLMKAKGQLLFTDYMLARPGLHSPEIERWTAHEPVEPHLWALDEYRDALGRMNFDVRVIEDITEAFHAAVTRGWAEFIARQEKTRPSESTTRALVDEVEIWTRRLQAIDAGDLKVCRLYGSKKGGEPAAKE